MNWGKNLKWKTKYSCSCIHLGENTGYSTYHQGNSTGFLLVKKSADSSQSFVATALQKALHSIVFSIIIICILQDPRCSLSGMGDFLLFQYL